LSALAPSRSAWRTEADRIPRNFWIVRLITAVAGLALQLVGLYAAWVAFGAWVTFALYTVGGLAMLLHAVVVRRLMPWSPGD